MASESIAQGTSRRPQVTWKFKAWLKVAVSGERSIHGNGWGEKPALNWGERSVRSNRTTRNIWEVAEWLKAPDMAILLPFYAGMAEK